VTASVVREGNSGKIVADMRNLTQEFDKEHDKPSAIIDGDSSIGCPVIAIVRGVRGELAVLYTTAKGINAIARRTGFV
jgi:MinD superfamily P-loop ATPase